VGVAVPATMTDGTENYTGVKLEAAQKALEFDRGIETMSLQRFGKARVEAVEPTAQGKDMQGGALRCTDDPTDARYYSVTVNHALFFGISYDKTELRGCNLFP
jgi:hypothetical protein